jgi:hypothetical protein
VPVTEEQRAALALSALGEITDPADVGDLLAIETVEPGVVDVRFACRIGAYADWHWTVSTSDLDGVEPTVLEVELLPGDDSLLAPPWVPWAERLAEWRKQHPDEDHPDELAEDDDEAEDDDADDDADDALDDDTDEDDLIVDDVLDELDEAELEGTESPEEAEQDAGDISDEDDDEDENGDRPARPGEVDRSL